MSSCGPRHRGRRAQQAPDDRGFTLLENVLAVVLVGLVLASAAVTFVGATRSAATLQRHQVAARLADQALAAVRAVPASPRADGCYPLLDGRTDAAVTAQWAARPAALVLGSTDKAVTPAVCAGHAATVPLRGLRTGPAQTVADPVVVGGQAYTVQTFVGTCWLPRVGGVCVPAAAVATTDVSVLYRVVVAVSWASDRGCAGGCLYSAETLRAPESDPLFDARRPVPSMPLTVAAVPGEESADVTWGAPASPGDSPVLGYTVTATPASGGAPVTLTLGPTATSAHLADLVDGVTYAVCVAAFNALGTGPAATTTVLPYPATVMTPARLAWWLDAADAATLTTDAAGAEPVTGTGQSVLRWKDKSPMHNDATVRPGQQPPVTLVGGGRIVPSWDGTTTCLEASASLLPHGSSPSTVFAVAQAADPVPAAAPYRGVVAWGTHVPGASRQLYKVIGSARVAADTAWWDIATASLDWSRTSPQLAAAQHDPDQTVLWAAGAPAVRTATGAARSTGTDAASIGCSIWPDGSVSAEHWQGPIHEVVVLAGTATAAERRTVEAYLARKWDAPITPDAPLLVAVTPAAPGSLAVAWDDPAYDGGIPVTGYTATASPGGATCTSSGSGCVLTGLTPGTAYTVTVTAANTMGAGPASAAGTATA